MINELLSKNHAKILSSLHLKKFRQKYQLFVVEGEKSVGELITSAPGLIKELIVRKGEILDYSKFGDFNTFQADENQMAKISTMSTPPGIIAVCKSNSYMSIKEPDSGGFVLYLDDVRDPGNAGTIIRTAEWFGFRKIFFSPGSIDLFHPRLIQATMGSFFRIFCREMDDQSMSDLPRPWIGATLDGQSLAEFTFPKVGTLFVGNESNGMRRELIDKLDFSVRIDAAANNHAESLNVGMATAILMYEISKGK